MKSRASHAFPKTVKRNVGQRKMTETRKTILLVTAIPMFILCLTSCRQQTIEPIGPNAFPRVQFFDKTNNQKHGLPHTLYFALPWRNQTSAPSGIRQNFPGGVAYHLTCEFVGSSTKGDVWLFSLTTPDQSNLVRSLLVPASVPMLIFETDKMKLEWIGQQNL